MRGVGHVSDARVASIFTHEHASQLGIGTTVAGSRHSILLYAVQRRWQVT